MIESTHLQPGYASLHLLVGDAVGVADASPEPISSSPGVGTPIRDLNSTAAWLKSPERDQGEAMAYRALYFLDDRFGFGAF